MQGAQPPVADAGVIPETEIGAEEDLLVEDNWRDNGGEEDEP
jgi:hypothetical protein